MIRNDSFWAKAAYRVSRFARLTGHCGLVVAATSLVMVGCSGDTSGGRTSEDYSGSEFLPSESTVGSMSLRVEQTDINVGKTSGFFVEAKDAKGAGVPGLRVACDSEKGVAIIEPTTGAELTDNFGSISGVLGCDAPGSYQFGCRLPIGINKRQFVTIKCSGPIPQGFTGFPGAAGGGLGTGGSAETPEGILRILDVAINDGGQDNTTSIDTTQDDCDPSVSVVDAELFTDSTASLTVVNETSQLWRASSLQYSLQGNGSASFVSDPIAVQGEVAGNGGQTTFTALIFKATGGGKRFVGDTANISFTDIRNVTFRLTLEDQFGEEVTIVSRIALSFGNFDRC